mgnify:CR=1 FL=1
MRLRRVVPCAAWVALAAFLAAGCFFGGGDKEEPKRVVASFLEDLASRRFEQAASRLSGDALDAAGSLLPALKGMEYEAKVSDLDLRVAEYSRSSGRALVDARYRLEQRVPGYGTVVQDVWAAFHLRRVGGEWKICLAYTVARK